MMAAFVHIGDVHARPGPRSADIWAALDQIITEGGALDDLAAWLIPGDLFDALSTTEDRNAWDVRLLRMAAVAPVVILYGNHDRKGDLDGFARLKGRWPILVVDEPKCVRVLLATNTYATIFCLPYPHKAGLVAAGVTPGAVVDTAADLLEPIFMLAANQLATQREQGDLTLMIGHVNVAGAQLSNGQPSIGHEIELAQKHLDRLGDIPKLLNHIHKPQRIAGAFYAGSVCRLDYGEIEEKRYLVVTAFNNPGSPIGVSYHVESKPIAVAPMFHIEGTLTRDGFLLASTPESEHYPLDWSGADVRVRYHYQASERGVISEAGIREQFKDALRLKVEGVAIPDRELRAPEVAAAITLAGKFAAYMKVDVLPPSLAEKLALLEGGDATAAIARVVDMLAQLEAREKASVAA